MSEQVRRYRIVRPLGRDPHGVTYEADVLDVWGKITAQLALLIFDPEAQAAVERLRALQPRLRGAQLPGVSRIDQLVSVDGRWAGIRHLYEGLTLSSILQHGPLPPLVVAEIGARVANTLHQAYSLPGADGTPQRLVHGSVQAHSVLVTEQGQVQLLGFGSTGPDPREGRSLEDEDMGWVPPERWSGTHERSGEVYSLGTVLYQSLTATPFPRVASVQDHQRLVPATLEALAPLGSAWHALLTEMLDPRPGHRPSALEVQRRCQEIVGQQIGALRSWATESLPGIRRKHTRPPADELCNLVFEISQVVELPELEDEGGVMAWDDVTSSYPLGAMRQGAGLKLSEADTVDEEPEAPTPTLPPVRAQPGAREAAGGPRSRGPWFVVFVASVVLAVATLGALAAALIMLGLGILG